MKARLIREPEEDLEQCLDYLTVKKKRRTVQEDEIKAADREEQCAFRTRELYQQ